MEDMVGASKGTCLFHGYLISGFFHDADKARVSTGVAADGTGLGLGKGITATAEVDGLVQLSQITRQIPGLGRGSAKNV